MENEMAEVVVNTNAVSGFFTRDRLIAIGAGVGIAGVSFGLGYWVGRRRDDKIVEKFQKTETKTETTASNTSAGE